MLSRVQTDQMRQNSSIILTHDLQSNSTENTF